jgi:hypothetical protein
MCEILKGAVYQTALPVHGISGDPHDESTWAMNRRFDYAVWNRQL